MIFTLFATFFLFLPLILSGTLIVLDAAHAVLVPSGAASVPALDGTILIVGAPVRLVDVHPVTFVWFAQTATVKTHVSFGMPSASQVASPSLQLTMWLPVVLSPAPLTSSST